MQAIITILLLLSWGYVFKNPHITDKYEVGYSAFVVIILLLMIIF